MIKNCCIVMLLHTKMLIFEMQMKNIHAPEISRSNRVLALKTFECEINRALKTMNFLLLIILLRFNDSCIDFAAVILDGTS